MAGRILVLDDEENYAKMLQDLLCEHNYRVDMATCPERAITLLEEIPYDLIISDYKMPVMDGSDFLRRSRELYPDLPFILVSGLMSTPELVKVANLNVTRVMEKPLDTEAFLLHVSSFSTPLTDHERTALLKSGEGEASGEADACPNEPRYICADSLISKRFVSQIWSKFKGASYGFLLEPVGGEADLVLRDLSLWRGNDDRPVQAFSFDEWVNCGVSTLETLATDEDHSHVVMVRLNSHDDILGAKEFVAKQLNEDSDVFIGFILSSSDSPKVFMDEVDGAGLVLPPLNIRPIDVANYIRRFLRIATERLNKPAAGVLSPEAVYTLLAHDWRSCRDIQKVIQALVSNGENTVISHDSVASELNSDEPLDAKKRLEGLLACAQKCYLSEALLNSDSSPSTLAASLELGDVIETEAELIAIPLVQLHSV